MKPNIAFLTAGGLAPCLSASIGALIEQYNTLAPDSTMVGYMHGYRGVLLGNSVHISNSVRQNADLLLKFGGSPIGNSRVKLTNINDCVRKGYVKEGDNPLTVAADQLAQDKITILHTIGGDDTNTIAAALSEYLTKIGYDLTVVGLPKTVDNDVFPITQTLGAWTAAEQGAIFFENIANENTTSTRQLIIHEIMGRNCGWLTAATTEEYRKRLSQKKFLPELLLSKERWDVDAVYVPEMKINLPQEAERLGKLMDDKDGINIFLSEGAGIESIVQEMEANGDPVTRDAFGHVRLDEINPGIWFAKRFATLLKAEKVLVQKSGYFARSAAPNKKDLDLITRSAALAAKCGLNGKSGVVGLDENNDDNLCLINFKRIKGGKPFNIKHDWFKRILDEINQPYI